MQKLGFLRHPFHILTSSPWPFVTALQIFLFLFGFIFFCFMLFVFGFIFLDLCVITSNIRVVNNNPISVETAKDAVLYSIESTKSASLETPKFSQAVVANELIQPVKKINSEDSSDTWGELLNSSLKNKQLVLPYGPYMGHGVSAILGQGLAESMIPQLPTLVHMDNIERAKHTLAVLNAASHSNDPNVLTDIYSGRVPVNAVMLSENEKIRVATLAHTQLSQRLGTFDKPEHSDLILPAAIHMRDTLALDSQQYTEGMQECREKITEIYKPRINATDSALSDEEVDNKIRHDYLQKQLTNLEKAITGTGTPKVTQLMGYSEGLLKHANTELPGPDKKFHTFIAEIGVRVASDPRVASQTSQVSLVTSHQSMLALRHQIESVPFHLSFVLSDNVNVNGYVSDSDSGSDIDSDNPGAGANDSDIDSDNPGANDSILASNNARANFVVNPPDPAVISAFDNVADPANIPVNAFIDAFANVPVSDPVNVQPAVDATVNAAHPQNVVEAKKDLTNQLTEELIGRLEEGGPGCAIS